jgi:hypothetical protein
MATTINKKMLIRACLGGIVYWVDNLTGDCYTYAEKPFLIGKAIKDPFEPKTLYIKLRDDWKTVVEEKRNEFMIEKAKIEAENAVVII